MNLNILLINTGLSIYTWTNWHISPHIGIRLSPYTPIIINSQTLGLNYFDLPCPPSPPSRHGRSRWPHRRVEPCKGPLPTVRHPRPGRLEVPRQAAAAAAGQHALPGPSQRVGRRVRQEPPAADQDPRAGDRLPEEAAAAGGGGEGRRRRLSGRPEAGRGQGQGGQRGGCLLGQGGGSLDFAQRVLEPKRCHVQSEGCFCFQVPSSYLFALEISIGILWDRDSRKLLIQLHNSSSGSYFLQPAQWASKMQQC